MRQPAGQRGEAFVDCERQRPSSGHGRQTMKCPREPPNLGREWRKGFLWSSLSCAVLGLIPVGRSPFLTAAWANALVVLHKSRKGRRSRVGTAKRLCRTAKGWPPKADYPGDEGRPSGNPERGVPVSPHSSWRGATPCGVGGPIPGSQYQGRFRLTASPTLRYAV